MSPRFPLRHLVGLLLGCSALHASGVGASAPANVAVKVRKAITLTQQADLNFGGLVVGTVGTGTATLNPRTNALTRGGTLIIGTFSAHARGQFRVTGTKATPYSVLLPANLTLVGSNGGTLLLSPMTFWSTAAASGTSGKIANNGRDTLRVGGTLALPNAVVDGDYAAAFTVVVAYN